MIWSVNIGVNSVPWRNFVPKPAVILPGVKVKNTSILATPISKAQPQMENVRISAAVPDLKWLHNPACKIQTESQVCYSMQRFSRKFLQLKDYITNRQKLQVWLYVCKGRHPEKIATVLESFWMSVIWTKSKRTAANFWGCLPIHTYNHTCNFWRLVI